MGWGNGMAIGWPMTSSTRGAKLGYFTILQGCNGNTYENTYSQQLPQTTYNEGDYVQCNNFDTRVVLGGFIEELPEKYNLNDLSGPAYTGCPVLRPFTITEICGLGPAGGCTIPIDTAYYNTGDFVYSPDLGARVRLGYIVPEEEECFVNYVVEGPKYNSCGI